MTFRKATLIIGGVLLGCSPNGNFANNMDGVQGNGGSGVGQPNARTPFPCDVAQVIAAKCSECHGTTPKGTPMQLLGWEDVTQLTSSRFFEGQTVAERMKDRINSPNSPMPPRTAAAGVLTPQELQTLNAWLDAGSPAGDGSALACQPPQLMPPPPGSGGATGAGGGYNPGTGGAGFGGSGGSIIGGGGTPSALPDGGVPTVPPEDVPVPPEPGECEYVQVRARANASGAPFHVPNNFLDKYMCFEFALNFPGPTQALQFKPVIGGDYVHHWLLYKKKPGIGSNPDQPPTECLGVHPDSELVAGWAPGAGDWNFPKHVGMNIGTGNFLLEVHYNNLGNPADDQSGVDVCVTQNLRPKTAGIHWLGTEFITLPPGQEKTEVSNCKPINVTEPIHILKSWPHMHLLGTRMRATIFRAGGAKEPLFDVPFDFNNQYQYDTPAIINAGDSIQTWCTWQNSTSDLVLFGERTREEMCYNFVVAYPEGSLRSLIQGIHSNSCQGDPIMAE